VDAERRLTDSKLVANGYHEQIKELAYYQKLKEQALDDLETQVTRLRFDNDSLLTELGEVRHTFVEL
jgi:DNA mismatch repair ATPase MutS